jgi:MFS family permease
VTRTALIAVAVTLVVQSLASMAMIVPAVLAPIVAPDLGVKPQTIGIFVSACYLCAMLSGLLAPPLIARLGARRICQLVLVMSGAGLALGGLAALAVVPLAAFAIGSAYGMVNPVSSQMLAHTAPPRMMSLIFSIKQTGVPIGGAIAGALAPTLLIVIGWPHTLVVFGIVCVLTALCLAAAPALEPARHHDAPRFDFRAAVAGLSAPVHLALSTPRLRELSAISFIYAQGQLVLLTYLVSYLNLGLGFSLVSAGLIFSFAQGAGIVGRILWGAVADRALSPQRMLGVLGLMAALGGVGAALFTVAWPLAAIFFVCAVFGASAIGWNGVYLAEVARRAPQGQIGTATGGTQFFTFLGALSGPPLFALVISASGSYAWGFALFAVPPLIAGTVLLLARR